MRYSKRHSEAMLWSLNSLTKQKRVKRQKTQAGEDLQPIPPKFVQNIAWFLKYGLKNKIIILIALSILSIGGYLQYGKLITPTSPIVQEVVSQQEEAVKDNHNEFPALLIVFSDGKKAYVEISYALQLDIEEFPAIISKFNNEETPQRMLASEITAKTYETLERTTIEFTRKNRINLARKIIEMTKPIQTLTGYKLETLQIIKIEEQL